MSRLKVIRKEKGMTQAQLAELAGVSLRMVQYYEQGYKDINKAEARTVCKLSLALGCDMEDLLEDESWN